MFGTHHEHDAAFDVAFPSCLRSVNDTVLFLLNAQCSAPSAVGSSLSSSLTRWLFVINNLGVR